MIIISGNQLFIEEWNEEKSDYVIRDWKNTDSLIYHYGDRVITENETTFGNVLYAFINDVNSEAISKTLKSVCDHDDILSEIKDRLNRNNLIDHHVTSLEISHVPIIRHDQYHSEPSLSTWEILGWGKIEEDDDDIDGFSTLSVGEIPLNQLEDLTFRIDPTVDIYNGDDFSFHDSLFGLPTVFDLIKCVCYEFAFYRKGVKIHETNSEESNLQAGSNFIGINDLLSKDD